MGERGSFRYGIIKNKKTQILKTGNSELETFTVSKTTISLLSFVFIIFRQTGLVLMIL